MKIAGIILRQRPFDDLSAELRRRGGENSPCRIPHGKNVITGARIAGCKLGGQLELRQTCLISGDSTGQVLGPKAKLPVIQ